MQKSECRRQKHFFILTFSFRIQKAREFVTQNSELDPHLLAALRLSLVDGVGPRIRQSLLTRFGTAQNVFDAPSAELLEIDGVEPKIAAAVVAAGHSRQAEEELAHCRELGIDLILRADRAYPPALPRTCDPPGGLFCRGRLGPPAGMGG